MSRHVDLNVCNNRSKNATGRDFIVLLCSWHRSYEVTLFCVPRLFYVLYCFVFVLLCSVFTVNLFCFVLVTLSLSRVGCLCYASLYCVRDIIPCECLCNIFVVSNVSLLHFAHTGFAFFCLNICLVFVALNPLIFLSVCRDSLFALSLSCFISPTSVHVYNLPVLLFVVVAINVGFMLQFVKAKSLLFTDCFCCFPSVTVFMSTSYLSPRFL